MTLPRVMQSCSLTFLLLDPAQPRLCHPQGLPAAVTRGNTHPPSNIPHTRPRPPIVDVCRRFEGVSQPQAYQSQVTEGLLSLLSPFLCPLIAAAGALAPEKEQEGGLPSCLHALLR